MHPVQRRRVTIRVLAASVLTLCLVARSFAAPVPAERTQSAPQRPYEVGTEGLVAPVPTKHVNPSYTPEALRQKIQGIVEVSAVVKTDGTVGDAEITKSLDTTYGLDEAALAAAKRWLFEPGRLNDKAVPVRVTLTLRFTLH